MFLKIFYEDTVVHYMFWLFLAVIVVRVCFARILAWKEGGAIYMTAKEPEGYQLTSQTIPPVYLISPQSFVGFC